MGNYKTINQKINAFRFDMEETPEWFSRILELNEAFFISINGNNFCIINIKQSSKAELVKSGEFILQTDYNLTKVHPDNFLTKWERI